MSDTSTSTERKPLVLAPGEGRSFPMGRLSAVFKADGAESAGLYSISEWWLDPHTDGPPLHHHPEDDTFYVLEGTMSFCLDGEWIDAPAGSFVLVPGNVPHAFDNRSDARAGMINFGAPGDFEQQMPGIAAWFVERDAGRTD